MRKSPVLYPLIILLLLTALAACRQDPGSGSVVVATAIPATEAAPTDAPATEAPATVAPTEVPAMAEPAAPELMPASGEIDWPPQLVAASPAPGADVPLNTTISVRFDQAMDQASVEAAFGITPAVDGTFTWPAPDTLVFEPADELERGSLYQVSLADSATAENGEALQEPVEISWETIGVFNVSDALPADGQSSVQTDAIITVVFDKPVVPLVATGDQADLPQPLLIEPAVDGRGEWTSTSIYRFIPEPALAGATTYSVTVDPELQNFAGGVIQDAPSWSFTTLDPEVVTVFPENRSILIAPTTTISMTFNMPMDPETTTAAVSLAPVGGGSISATTSWSEDGRTIFLDPDSLLPLETEIVVTAGTGATAASGAASLPDTFVSTFSTVPFPAVVRTQPADGETAEIWDRGFSIEFAASMNRETVEDRLIIEPAVDDVDYFISAWEEGFSVYVEANLEPDQTYTVTVPGDAADPYGNTLGDPYIFSFNTPPPQPVASLNLPRDLAQLSDSFPTAVDVLHRNVSALALQLYEQPVDIDLLFNTWQLSESPPAGNPLATFDIPVDTPEGELGVTAVELADGGTLPLGMYRLTLDAPEINIEDTRWWQNQNALLIVADTNIVVKEMFGEVHVWATDLASGEPVADLDVTLYDRQGTDLGTAVTDADGFASFDYQPAEPYLEGVVVVSSAPGQPGFGVASSNWNGSVTPWQLGLQFDGSAEADIYAYIYTDRPIYRPGDTVFYKGIVRETMFGRYTLPQSDEVDLTLSRAFYIDGEPFEENFTHTLDEDGVFYGEYIIPEDAVLGTYDIYLVGENAWNSSRQFTIAEYRAPEFLITMTATPTETVRGDTASALLDAEYLFGGSAGGLSVGWNAQDSLYIPTFPTLDEYVFGDQAGLYYVDSGPFGPFGGFDGGTVASGEGETEANGEYRIDLPADMLDESRPGSREVTVESTVGGVGEFPVSNRTTLVYHAAEAYTGISVDDPLPDAGDEVAVNVIAVDWAGEPVAGLPIEVVFYEREWESERSTEFGMYYTQWTPVDTEVGRATVTSGEDGTATASFTPQNGGTYLVAATLTDDAGRQQTSATAVYAFDPAYAGWRTDPNQRSMELVPDKDSYVPGDTAEILVQSPFAQPVQAWLTIERGNLLEQRVVTVNGSEIIEIPIDPLYAPNVHVGVTAVKPVDPADPDFPYADIRLGIVELLVSTELLELDVALTPGQAQYEPGDTATFDVALTDLSGNPVAGEVSLALVDLAVLSLKDDNAPPIVDGFYSPQPYRSQTGSGLFITGEGLEVEEPQQGGGLGGGGGDATESAAVRLEDEDGDVRQNFKDTAYWEAKLVLDGSGRATVEVPLPDNLTTWRMHSKGVTPDTRVGQNSVDIQTRLPLLVRPVTPRFFAVGDALQLGANVNNTTGSDIEATVTLDAAGVTVNSPVEQVVTVPANGRARVRWDVVVQDVPLVDLTFSVDGGGYSDATKPVLGTGPGNSIRVTRVTGRDFVATAGELSEAGRRVEAVVLPEGIDSSQGQVTIKLQPSLAAAIIETFDVVEGERGDDLQCPGSAVDRLLQNTATSKAISELDLALPGLDDRLGAEIRLDLGLLTTSVKDDGGWGWCFSSDSDPWLSAQALLGLSMARDLGYNVDAGLIDGAETYVDRQLEPVDELGNASQANRQAFFLYVLSQAGTVVTGDADALFNEHRALMDPYAKALLAQAYEASGAGGENQAALLTDLNDEVIMSATGAHWEDDEQDVANLNSTIRGTAMVIDALAQLEPDSALLPPAVRWLMVNRTAEVWPSLHQTAWSVLALSDWMVASGELDANYAYQLNVNLQPESSGAFTPEMVTESELIEVPVDDLLPPADINYFDFQRGEGDGLLYYTLHLDSAISVDAIDPVSRGMTVSRQYFDAACDPETETCLPIDTITAGDRVRVELTLVVPDDRTYVLLEDPIPAGTEAIDPNLLTSASGAGGSIVPQGRENGFGYWGWWYFDHIQYKDDAVVFLSQYLPAGTYQYSYFLETLIPGTYQALPATARESYFPEVFGRSAGDIFVIEEPAR